MTGDPHSGLSAREREVLDILYRRGPSTADEVLLELESPPTNATVRSLLRVLEEKGRLIHDRDGARFVYRPVAAPESIRRQALEHLVKTFYQGSAAQAAAALLGASPDLDDKERRRIMHLLDGLEREGR